MARSGSFLDLQIFITTKTRKLIRGNRIVTTTQINSRLEYIVKFAPKVKKTINDKGIMIHMFPQACAYKYRPSSMASLDVCTTKTNNMRGLRGT